MVFFNYSTMQMVAKIVYYGPGLCGKTTNLNHIYEKTSPKSRGEMVSLATETDRTLFFDLLPLDVGLVGGFKTKFQLYTVPGQVFYNATRKLVLKGVDGIVFVADSQVPMLDANSDSMANMWENLEELGLDGNSIPIVLQYNKRDLDNVVPIDRLNQVLNPAGFPYVEASAINGQGVFETLKEVSKSTLLKLKNRVLGDDLQKKSKSSKVEFKVQGSKGIKEAILEESGSNEMPYEHTKVEEQLPSVEELEPINMPEAVSFEDYSDPDATPSSVPAAAKPPVQEPAKEETGELSKINFDHIEIDELEEEIESIEDQDLLEVSEEVDFTSELEEIEFDEKTGADYEPAKESEDVDDTAPAQKPPVMAKAPAQRPSFVDAPRMPAQPIKQAPVAPPPPKPEPVNPAPAAKSSSTDDLLKSVVTKTKSTPIRSGSVDDLLSGLVTGAKPNAKPKVSKHAIQVHGKLKKAQMNCIFLDESGSVIHTQLIQVDPVPTGVGTHSIKIQLEIKET